MAKMQLPSGFTDPHHQASVLREHWVTNCFAEMTTDQIRWAASCSSDKGTPKATAKDDTLSIDKINRIFGNYAIGTTDFLGAAFGLCIDPFYRRFS